MLDELARALAGMAPHLHDIRPGMDSAQSSRTTQSGVIAYLLFGTFNLHLPRCYDVESADNSLYRTSGDIVINNHTQQRAEY